MTAPTPQLGLKEVLKIKAVRTLWLAQIVSVFGDFLVLFAVLSVASFQLNATPAQVTFISIAFMLPFALIGPLAGVFVDRWNVKRTMIASDLIRATLAQAADIRTMFYASAVFLALIAGVGYFFLPQDTPEKSGAPT